MNMISLRRCFLIITACLLPGFPGQAQTYQPIAKTICTTKSTVNVRRGPDTEYTIQKTLPKGSKIRKIGKSGQWSAVKMNGNVCYIKSSYLKKMYKIFYVSGDLVNLRTGPGTNYDSVSVLPQGTKLKTIKKVKGWRQVKYQGGLYYIKASLTSKNKVSATSDTVSSTSENNTVHSAQVSTAENIREKAISAAKERLGDTYSQAKRDQPGYADCSSLLRDIFLQSSGVNIGNTTTEQISRLSSYKKDLSQLKTGDILMRIRPEGNHAGIYIGNGQYIHASSSRRQVIISSYYSSYWSCCYDAGAYCEDNYS